LERVGVHSSLLSKIEGFTFHGRAYQDKYGDWKIAPESLFWDDLTQKPSQPKPAVAAVKAPTTMAQAFQKSGFTVTPLPQKKAVPMPVIQVPQASSPAPSKVVAGQKGAATKNLRAAKAALLSVINCPHVRSTRTPQEYNILEKCFLELSKIAS
jgi:hypothetical protein